MELLKSLNESRIADLFHVEITGIISMDVSRTDDFIVCLEYHLHSSDSAATGITSRWCSQKYKHIFAISGKLLLNFRTYIETPHDLNISDNVDDNIINKSHTQCVRFPVQFVE
jgi:hypothetical protein